MTTKKNNLVKLAKGKRETPIAPAVKKEEVKVPEKVLTPEEERDLKTKAKVDELLDGVKLTLEPEVKKDDLLEVVEDEEPKGVEWLEEQMSRLTEENEKLKAEATLAKADYEQLFAAFQQQKNTVVLNDNPNGTDTLLKAKVVQLFNEIQANHLALGHNFIIVPVAFLNRLILFFPFLDEYKRF
jgi:hypothetical protein